MTREKFYKENCLMCGTQRCPGDDEAISTCGRYEGDIEGIEKKKRVYKNCLREYIERKENNEKRI